MEIDWIIWTFGSVYICVCVCVCVRVFNILKVIVRDVVSCLVWFHSDSDLLGFCSISHSCNIMRCESQGQVLCICVCVFSRFWVSFVCLYLFVCLFILLSHFVSQSLRVFVFVHVCLCVVS